MACAATTTQSLITVEPKKMTRTASERDEGFCNSLGAGNDSDRAYGDFVGPGRVIRSQPRLEFSDGDIALEMEGDTESDQLDAAMTDTDQQSGRPSRQLQPSEAEEFLENNQFLYPTGHAMQRERRSGIIEGLWACLSPVISLWGKDKKQVCTLPIINLTLLFPSACFPTSSSLVSFPTPLSWSHSQVLLSLSHSLNPLYLGIYPGLIPDPLFLGHLPLPQSHSQPCLL